MPIGYVARADRSEPGFCGRIPEISREVSFMIPLLVLLRKKEASGLPVWGLGAQPERGLIGPLPAGAFQLSQFDLKHFEILRRSTVARERLVHGSPEF